MELLKPNDPLLRHIAVPVTLDDPHLPPILSEINDRLQFWSGYGIAAPQLGVSQRVIGVKLPRENYDRESYILLNPTLVEKSGWQWNLETCLSLPGKIYLVPRYETVTVHATLPSGEPIVLEERKFRAAILQHEIDHLDGILIRDYGLLSRKAVRRE